MIISLEQAERIGKVTDAVKTIFSFTVILSIVFVAAWGGYRVITTPPHPVLNVSNTELAIHDAVNKMRAENGAAPLCLDPTLAKAARLRSNDMVARNYFSHFAPDGTDYSDVMADMSITADAENIAVINEDDEDDPNIIAFRYVHSLPTSRLHWLAANNRDYKCEGIGVAFPHNEATVYVTQLFI